VPPVDGAPASEARPPRARARWLVAAKIVVSVAFLAVLFRFADMGIVLERLKSAAPGPLILSFILLGWQTAISSIKWRQILGSDGFDVPLATLIRVNATGTFVSLFLPSSFGGDIYRVAALRPVAGGLVRSTASVMFDRGSGLFALATISVVSYQFYPRNPHAWAFIAAWFAAIAAFVVFTSRSVLDSRWWPRFQLAKHLRKFVATLHVYRSSGRLLARVMMLSLVFQLTMVVINGIYAHALGIDIAFATMLLIVPLVYLTEVIPVGINGIGIRDSAYVLAFAAIGRPAEEALAISLLLIAMRYLYGFACGVFVLILHLTRRNAAGG
jgi:hypothetical protein